MKQSNNAIKFLMAQYRAVFKRAFLANLGLAVVVSTGLAGTANAADSIAPDSELVLALAQKSFTGSSGSTWDDAANKSAVVSGDHTFKEDSYFENLTITSGTTTISGGKAVSIRGQVTVNSGATLQLGRSNKKASLAGFDYRHQNDPNNGAGKATGDLLNKGNLIINGNAQFNKVVLYSGSDTTLSGTGSNQYWNSSNQLIGGLGDNGSFEIQKDATVNLNQYASLVASQNSTMEIAGNINFNDSGTATVNKENSLPATAFIRGVDNYYDGNFKEEEESNAVININEGANLTVAEGTSGAERKAGIYSAVTNINGGKIHVGKSGTMTFDGDFIKKDVTIDKATYAAGLFTMTGGTITLDDNAKLIVGGGSYTKDNLDSKDVDESKLKTTLDIQGGSLKGTGTLQLKGNLKISETVLDGFLDASLSDTNTGHIDLATASGSNATRIEIVNAKEGVAVDLHDYSFSTTNGSKNFNIDSSSGGTIYAKDLAVSDQLSGSTSFGGLYLEADNLILGNANYDSTDTGKSLGFGSATAKNVEFISKNNEFVFKDTLTLENTRTIKDQDGKDLVVGESGSITGDVKLVSGGSITVNGGFYTADQITASGGKVSVQDPTLKSGALKSDIQSSLTINNLSLGTADNSEISASGKHSSLTIGELSFIEDSKGVIKADHGAVVNLDADFVQEVLNQAAKANNGSGSKNIQFTAANTGTLNINGDITLDFTSNNSDALDEVIHFASGNAGQAGNVIAKSVTINGKGIQSDQLFYQGVGKLYVQDLSLNAYDENNAVIKDAVATLSNGHYYITNSLNSANANSNGKLKLSSTDSNIGSKLFLGDVKEVLGADSQVKYYEATSNSGNVNIDLIVDQNAELNVKTGAWDAQAIDVTSGKVTVGALNSGGVTYKNVDGNDITASLTGTKLTMTGGGKFTVNSTGTAEFNGLDTSGLSASDISVSGLMTINGGAVTEEDKTNEIKLGSGTVKVNQNGELVIRDAALTNSFFGTDYAVKDNVKNGISVGSNGIVKLDFAGGEISLDQLKQIKTDLFGATNGQIDGVLNIGKAQIGGLKFENDNTITWDNLKPVSDVSSDVTNEKLLGAKVTGVDSPFKSHVGSIDSKNQRVEINGNSSLNNAADNGGMFASYNGEVANVNITNGSDLTLRNEGSIGEITLKGAVDNQAHLYTDGVGKVTIANVSGDSGSSFSANTETLVTKDVKAGEVGVDANGSLEVQGKLTATNDLYNEGKLAVVGDAKVEKDFSTSGQASFENSLTVSGTADVFGNTTVNAKATFNSDVNIGGDATLKADEIVLKDVSGQIIGNVFAVGKDNYEFNGETVEGSTGYLEANSFKLAGNTLIVDPAYGKKTSIAAIKSFTTNNNKVEYAGIVNGKLIVGQNAALMLGKDASIAKMQEFIAQYQDGNGSLQADNVGSVVYLTDKLTLNSGSRVILDSERSHSDILGTKGNIGSLYDNTYKAQFNGTGTDLEADLYIGSNTVLAAGDKILTQGGAIHFDKTDASIMAGGDGSGKVVLVGDGFMNSRNITLFTDNGDSTTNSEGVKVLGTNDIRVESLNGLMYFDLKAGTETTGGTLELDISKTRNAFLGASAPMRDFLIAYASKTNNWSEYYRDTTNVARDYLVDTVASPDLATWDKDTNTITLSNEAKKMGLTENDFVILNDGTAKEALYRMAHNSFLERVVRNSDGAAADQASRMGVFGGAAQAALSSAAASYEAISGRFGVGLNYNLTAANNGQGAGMWVSPIYKSYDSDGFATQGKNYGADIDLYGVALGGDYTMSNGLRFGAMFNVGGGDADGNGFAAGISNDFNYYGFGLYAGYAYDKFSVVADITYTVVDSDVDANTDIEKVSTSFDTDSLSLGVTGQYKLDLNGMSVTPHAGLRFTRLDMDSYNINGTDGKIGEFDTSSANVFSVPVGVTFAKEFQGEEWSVQPSFDLTLTGNFGDDDLDGSVRWTGVSRTVSSNTEFIDSFTYGATVGLSATNGNFSFGAGLNYTGSSNTDEFGINATARFLF